MRYRSPDSISMLRPSPAPPKPATLPCMLADSPFSLLRVLSTEEGTTLLTLSSRRTLEKGATIATSSGAMESVYLIIQGTLKIHAIGKASESAMITIGGSGELISSFTGEVPQGYQVTLMALRPTELLWLNMSDFQRALQTIPTFSRMVVDYVAQRLIAKECHAYAMMRRGVLERVAYALHTLVLQHGHPLEHGEVLIPFALTQSDLAAMIGASRIRVNHALQTLKQEGIVSLARHHQVVVHNVGALASWSASPQAQPVAISVP